MYLANVQYIISVTITLTFQAAIDAAVKELLSFKAAYKAETGVEWSPNATTPSGNKSTAIVDVKADPSNKSSGDMVSAQIKECGDRVRDLKSKKAEKVHQKFDYLFTHTHFTGTFIFN